MGLGTLGGVFLCITILEGDSFCMDDSLEIGAPYGNEGFPHFSILSLQLFGDKQHLGGEDFNIPKLAHS